ncbi:site-specific DNA-methyltransferase [Sinorhizobium meliloti]|uniref:site-specific DNA-methyltransferase n=1 Tax=Rhizobium meliloti TaxID=382 RepID=UPI0004297E02|nr:site-specific DNA-methyltransferase [Sinorhizobium meliloti]
MTKKTRLELNWVGKDDRPKLEPRILVEDATRSYHAHALYSEKDIFDNILIHGDNLLGLRAIEAKLSGKIKCIYIDPPFNTQQAFEHYPDGIEHSLWLSLMRERLQILHRLLADEGSFFLHIDDNELGYIICVADEIFGRANRISVVSFKQSSVSGPKSINPGIVNTHNYILYYCKDKSKWKPQKVFVGKDRDARYSTYIEDYEKGYEYWRFVTLASAFAAYMGLPSKDLKKELGDEYDQRLDSFVIDNAHRVTQLASIRPQDINEEARASLLQSIDQPNKIFYSPRTDKDDLYFKGGKQILFYSTKVKLIDGEAITGEALSNSWDDILSNNVHKEGGVSFPNGKKPEALIKRVLELSTSPGDWVLDSFAGSGTTAAAAHKMGRRWVAIELGEHALTHIVPRMQGVIAGDDQDGISKSLSWKGGGGFRFYRLAPSLLQKDRFGNWVISKEYNAAMLAEALCEHLGFTYAPSQDLGEYWRHGHSTETDFIYVTTQSLTYDALKKLSEEVGPKRTLLVCCKAFNAKEDSFPNLTVKKIPHSILAKCEWGRDDYSLRIANLPEQKASNDPAADSSQELANARDEAALPLFNVRGGN